MDVAPLVEFPLFPHLPTELRLEIWKRALELPRAVPITITAEQQQQPLPPHWRCPVTCRQYEHACALFFVNRESRTAALGYGRYGFFCVEERGRHPGAPPLHFALAANDFVVARGADLLRTLPRCAVVPSSGCADDGPAIRRVLILHNEDELFDEIGAGPWLPSGWPHTAVMRRAMAREAFQRVLHVLAQSHSGAAASLESLHCLADGWTAAPRGLGLRSPGGLESVEASVWDSRPLLERAVTLYDRKVDGDCWGGAPVAPGKG